jgi:CelD/BcsL family acetyltransferase involved in cellulose biosynthesis
MTTAIPAAARPPAPTEDAPLRVEVVSDPAAFVAMGAEWNDLLAQSPQGANPMLTHEWFRAWWEAFGAGRELLVLRVTAGGRLVALAPLMLGQAHYYGLPCRLLSFITNDHTNRTEIIAAELPEACARLVLEFARDTRRRWDMLELNFVPAASPTAAVVAAEATAYGLACEVKPSYDSPYIPLAGDWEQFYRGLDGHFRRNMKNRQTRLAKHGAVELEEWSPARRPLAAWLDDAFAVGERSWKGAEKTAIGSTPEVRRFYTRLAELAHPRGWLSLHLLTVAGAPVAFHYSLRADGVLGLLKTEYDTAWHSYSPGHQIQKLVLRACYERGLPEFDFLGPDMPWKREWARDVRLHVRLLLFHRGPWSQTLAFLERRLKPALKRAPLVRRVAEAPPSSASRGGDS